MPDEAADIGGQYCGTSSPRAVRKPLGHSLPRGRGDSLDANIVGSHGGNE